MSDSLQDWLTPEFTAYDPDEMEDIGPPAATITDAALALLDLWKQHENRAVYPNGAEQPGEAHGRRIYVAQDRARYALQLLNDQLSILSSVSPAVSGAIILSMHAQLVMVASAYEDREDVPWPHIVQATYVVDWNPQTQTYALLHTPTDLMRVRPDLSGFPTAEATDAF